MSRKISVEILPPQDNTYKELLRFWCQTSEADDPSLSFMASMWSFAIANDDLTGKQAKSADAYIKLRLKEYGLEEVLNENI